MLNQIIAQDSEPLQSAVVCSLRFVSYLRSCVTLFHLNLVCEILVQLVVVLSPLISSHLSLPLLSLRSPSPFLARIIPVWLFSCNALEREGGREQAREGEREREGGRERDG